MSISQNEFLTQFFQQFEKLPKNYQKFVIHYLLHYHNLSYIPDSLECDLESLPSHSQQISNLIYSVYYNPNLQPQITLPNFICQLIDEFEILVN